MKNSSFISDSVFKLSLYYTQKQNKTKQLFFKCLDQNKSEEYFRKELKKIWGEETEYIEKQITIFREELHKEHTSTKLGTITIAGLGITKQLIDKTNQQFIEKKIRDKFN